MKGLNSFKRIILIVLVSFMSTLNVFAEETVSLMSDIATTSLDATFDCDVIFWNNNGYDEYVVENKNTLGVDLRIKNNSNLSKTIQPYFALYENGRLLEAKMLSSQTVNAGNEANYTESINVNGNNTVNYTAKVFNWADGNLRPLSESVSISGSKADFYGNSIANAILIQDVDKEVKGTINVSNDVDYLEIIPDSTNTYSLKTFSTSNVIGTLYNSSGAVLVSNSASIDYTLTANTSYYVKLSNSGTIGDYIFTISGNQSNEAATFDVYKFDVDVNVFKKSILEICDDLYYDDVELSKQMYSEFEEILDDDAKLHALPDFLADHPKDISNFDELLNDYYGTKYDSFEEIKQRYIALIDKYTEVSELSVMNANENDIVSVEALNGIEEAAWPIVGKSVPIEKKKDSIEAGPISPGDQTQQTTATPSLTIVNTTETSITYNATFPVSGQWGNAIYMVDFNTDDGLTTWENVYGTDEYRTNGQYTISGLQPSGIYILNMMWSTDGELMGNENAINRFVQLPNTSSESLSLYSGGRVTARLEASDKTLASSADFNEWLDRMDDAYYAYKELTGYTPYNSKKIEMRSTRQNLNDYFDITDGHYYCEVIFGYYDYTNVFKHSKAFYQGHMRRLSQDDWGDTPMHELSHVFDRDRWNFDAETLAQFKLYYVVEQLNAKVYRPDRYDNNSEGWYTGENYYDLLKYDRYLDSYDASFNSGNYASEGFAVILIDIQREIGWEPFKKTFRYFSNLSSSQVLYDEGEILKLFLTKLKDYSGEDVLAMISNRDTGIIEDWYGITLEYVEPIYPSVSGGGSSGGGGSSQVTVDKGNYSTFQFTPTESANYYIYTSPYGGSGVSNDTIIEVYNNSSLSGTPLASNDDYDGGRFSKVSVAMTEGTTYYIKVRHYNNGQLHAELNITKNVPVVELSLDGYEDIRVAKGEFALYSYTPTKSITHVFEVGNYSGGSTEYDTYIKLYGNESMTQRIGNHNNKIIVNLTAGHTYYLQFSGFLMRSSRGRISVREGQTLKPQKKEGGSFLYINNPEKFTDMDIIQQLSSDHLSNNLIYHQEEVAGYNTLYVTHSCSNYNKKPTQPFYYDIDFENPTGQPVSIRVDKLNHLVTGHYSSLVDLYYDRLSDYSEMTHEVITIPANSHILLYKDVIGQSLLMPIDVVNENYYLLLGIFLDFEVLDNATVTVNTLATYDEEYLDLTTVADGKIYANASTEINGWKFETDLDDERVGEDDIMKKMKGIDRTGLAEVKGELYYAVDDSVPSQRLPVNLIDDYFKDGMHNPKDTWIAAINPFNDIDWGLYKSTPSALHGFEYKDSYNGVSGTWYFDFEHLNPKVWKFADYAKYADPLSEDELNFSINDTFLDYFAYQASIPRPQEPLLDYPLPENVAKETWQDVTMMMGAWGVTYTYDIYVANNGTRDRYLEYILQMANFAAVEVNIENLTTGETTGELKRIISDYGTDDFLRQNHILFDVELKSKNSYHIKVSILNGVGTTGFDNWLELSDEQ